MINCFKNLTLQRGPVLCPPWKPFSLNGRQNNCHRKNVAAHGWGRNHIGRVKVIKLGLGVVYFSERGCTLDSPSVGTQTQEDHGTHSNLWEEEMHFKTLCIERKMIWAERRKKKKQDKGKTGKIHPSQSMTETQRKPSLHTPIPVSSWKG